jgi:hypothetical protein
MEEKLFIIILSCYTVSANRKSVENKKKSKTFLSNTQSYVFGAKVFNLKKIKFCSNISFEIVKVFFYFKYKITMEKPFFVFNSIHKRDWIFLFPLWGEQEGVASRSKDDIRRSSVSSAPRTGNGNRRPESAVCKIRQSLLQGGSWPQAIKKCCS